MDGKFSQFVCGGKLAATRRLCPPKTCEIDPLVSSAERFLLMTFPLITGHNMFMDPCLVSFLPLQLSLQQLRGRAEEGFYRLSMQRIYRQSIVLTKHGELAGVRNCPHNSIKTAQ